MNGVNVTESRKKKLFWVIVLNIGITIGEIVGGFLSNSLALLSDAVHNFGDVISIVVSYLAVLVSQKEQNKRYTFGYKRAEILSAFFNSLLLILVSVFIVKEAIHRFFSQSPIDVNTMLLVATLGLAGNFISVIILKSDAEHNLNIKSSYLHLLADTLSSVVVIIGGIAIYFWRIYTIDTVLSVFISIFLVKEAIEIAIKTSKILMEQVPEHIDIASLAEEAKKIEPIKNIHHIHIWQIGDEEVYIECHVDLKENLCIKEVKPIKEKLNALFKNYGITHSTLQFEYDEEDSGKLIL